MNTKTFPRANVLGRYGIKDGNATPPNPPTDPNVLTLDDMRKELTGPLIEAIKSLRAPQAPPAAPPAAPPTAIPGVTPETLQAAIKAAMADFAKDSVKLTKDEIKSVVDDAIKEIFENSKRGNKVVGNPNDAKSGQSSSAGLIEIPTGWTKGNLPLHGKQLLNVLMKRSMNDGVSDDIVRQGEKYGEAIMSRYSQRGYVADGKALTSTGTGAGDELVPTSLAAEIQRRMYLSSELMAALLPQELDMPTNPFTYPLITTLPTFLLEATENTSATDSPPGTGVITLTAMKLMAKVLFSYELNEDAIIAIIPMLQQVLAQAAAQKWESALLNGDTTATHMDSDTEAIAKAGERAIKGLRKLALAVTELKLDLSTGGITAANILSMKARMGKYGMATKDLILVPGITAYNKILGLAEVLTAEKAGPSATILTGKLASIFGIPIIPSAFQREDLNASGVYDGTTKTKGAISLFNKTQFLLGRRRDLLIETDKDIESQQNVAVASFRRGFIPVETPSATVQSVVVGYNF